MDLLFTLHSALDTFEQTPVDGKSRQRKTYLGLRNLVDGYAVYGHYSNSLIKTIVILEAPTELLDDVLVERYLKELYSTYVDTISNPFFDIGASLEEKQPVVGSRGRPLAYPELQKSFSSRIDATVTGAILAKN